MPRKALSKRPRTSPKPRRNAAWNTIIEGIEESQSSLDPEAWADTPWRSWSNAVALCLGLWDHVKHIGPKDPDAERAGLRLQACVFTEQFSYSSPTEYYWEFDELRRALRQTDANRLAYMALENGLAVAQMGVSKSDGGGAAFTSRMANMFRAFVADDIEISVFVQQIRRLDALGPNASPARAKAFDAAWSLGRYSLAYLV